MRALSPHPSIIVRCQIVAYSSEDDLATNSELSVGRAPWVDRWRCVDVGGFGSVG